MSLGEEYMNDSAYEREQALEEWERESIEEEQIRKYDDEQREIARRMRCTIKTEITDVTDVGR